MNKTRCCALAEAGGTASPFKNKAFVFQPQRATSPEQCGGLSIRGCSHQEGLVVGWSEPGLCKIKPNFVGGEVAAVP